MLYHWSPSERRAGINRHGLLPGKRPSTHVDDSDWRAPYVCLAEDPNWGWALSGGICGQAGQSWDLWIVYLSEQHTIRRIRHWNDGDPNNAKDATHPRYHEWRVFDRVYKRGVIYVGTRVLPCGPTGP